MSLLTTRMSRFRPFLNVPIDWRVECNAVEWSAMECSRVQSMGGWRESKRKGTNDQRRNVCFSFSLSLCVCVLVVIWCVMRCCDRGEPTVSVIFGNHGSATLPRSHDGTTREDMPMGCQARFGTERNKTRRNTAQHYTTRHDTTYSSYLTTLLVVSISCSVASVVCQH